MSEPGDLPTDDGDEPASQLDRALESLKRAADDADDHAVSSDARTRMSWSSVTEADSPLVSRDEPRSDRSTNDPGSGFQFDLGSALARLGDEVVPAESRTEASPPEHGAPLPTRGTPAEPDRSEDDLPRRGVTPDLAPDEPSIDERSIDEPTDGEASIDEASIGEASIDEPSIDEPTIDEASIDEPTIGEVSIGAASIDEPTDGEVPIGEASIGEASIGEASIDEPPDGDGEDLPRRNPSPVATVRPSDDPLPRREPAPQASPTAPTAPAAATASAPAAAPAPTPSPVTHPSRPASSAPRSVFEDAAPAPTLPNSPASAPPVEPVLPNIPAATAAGLPTLPEANPAAPPQVAEAISSAPATPDINAVRSYQLRAQRDERRSKIFGRSLLAILFLAAAVAAALIFGRSYLFPTQWDAELTPFVDQIQEARDAEFDGTVPLTTLPDGEYAAIALEIVAGPQWSDELPAWRALGIAAGGDSSDAIHRAVIEWRPALYDPVTETIYRATTADPEALASAYTVALTEVFERQRAAPPNTAFPDEAGGVLGVSSAQAISSQAIDYVLLGGQTSALELLDDSPAPLPLLYQFAAVDTFGEPLLALPEAQGVRYGDAYPDALLTASSVDATRAASGLSPAGTQSLGAPVALGPEAWAMVFENRLPVRTVERLSTLITADSYRPVEQGATRCFVANFQATSDAAAGEVLGALARWTVAAPETAGAVATLVAPNRVELFACDPGATVEQSVNSAAVASVVATQVARLAGA